MTAKRNPLLVIIVVAACIGLIGWGITALSPPAPKDTSADGDGGANQPSNDGDASDEAPVRFTAAQMQIAIEAVAASEEAKFLRARDLWTQLREAFPADRDIQINEAVAVLKWTNVVSEQLNNQDAKTTPEQRAAMEAELSEAFDYADTLLEDLQKVNASEYDYRVPLIQSALLTERAERADYEQSAELKKQAAQVLIDALSKDPQQPVLASKLDQVLLGLAGTAPDLEAQLPDFLFQAFNVDGDNLYLLKAAATALLTAQDARVKQLVQPTINLSKPMWSSRQRAVDRMKPEELAVQTIEAIDAGNWRGTVGFRRWLNVLLGIPGFNDDYKRVTPDPLALLDTSFLLRMAPERSIAPQATKVEFSEFEIDASATAAAWVDVDYDFVADVVIATGNELQFYIANGSEFQFSHAIPTDKPITNLMALDLYEVLIPEAPKLPSSVAELMIEGTFARESAADDENSDGEDRSNISGSRHAVLRELVASGPEGIEIYSLESVGLVTDETGLEGLRDVKLIEAADIESDGDLDLLIVTGEGPVLMQNNGNRTFSNITEYSSLLSDVSITGARRADFDQDLDQDFLLATSKGPAVLENILHSQFRMRMLDGEQWKTESPTACLAVADFDRNRSWDVVFGGATESHLVSTLTSNSSFAATRRQAIPIGSSSQIAATDINNDGFMDLIAAGSDGLSYSLGQTSLEFSPPQSVAPGSITTLSIADHNYDGKQEILAIADGKPVVYSLQGQLDGNYNVVRLAGINDNNGGGRINHFGLGSVLEVWTNEGPFRRLVDGPVTHFGLGGEEAKTVRVIFTNGLTQNIENVPANVLVEEIQIQRGSCPYVYGHDGKGFELITDLLWNAPLGLQISRGEALPDRRWEHILLPGQLVKQRGETIPLKITEELWEFAYFDHVQLTAIDHPQDVRVFTNEKVGPPQIAEPRIFAVRNTLHPQQATDTRGKDCTKQLSKTDRDFVQAFEKLYCQGLCEPHFIELDFGELDDTSDTLRLYLNGWLYPTDTSLNIGISQNPQRSRPEPPSLWVVGQDGQWTCAKPFIGFPGGKPKTIVVDISGIFETDDHRIRIATSQQLYWDEVFVSADDLDDYQTHTLKLATADLHYRGYSKPLHRDPEQPHWFDYQQVETSPIWPRLNGPFTRYGDVRSILNQDDDEMAVIVGGDEISLEFVPPAASLPENWSRDFVLHSTGWDKDADINTLEGQSSLPLPFKNQASYPAMPDQAEEAQAVFEKNAATLTRYMPTWTLDAISRAGWQKPKSPTAEAPITTRPKEANSPSSTVGE